MVKKSYFYFIFYLLGITSYSQKVSNINKRQEKSTIIVSYDLETKMPCKITLFVSTNGGSTWQGPLTKVTGEVGNKIASGSHSITWNVLEEFEELRGDKIMFQVQANVDNIETITIGNQEWTVKNLDVSRYRNGDIIPEVKDPKEWAKLTTGAWCYNNNDPNNGAIYGKLYNWYAVNDKRGLAPKGFHIPTVKDSDILIAFLGGEKIAGGKMKESGTTHWYSSNLEATNSSGFTGLPGGFRGGNGTFNEGSRGIWWSSSNISTTNSLYICISDNDRKISIMDCPKTDGFSVRCLKD